MIRRHCVQTRLGHGVVAVLASAAIVCVCVTALLLMQRHTAGAASGRLMVYCAAGLQQPVSELAADYARETGIEVQLQYGGTGTLLGTIAVAKVGDCFLTADESTVDLARQRGLMADALPLARQRPVIGVALGNPKHIASLADLMRPGIRLGLANPEAAAIGKLTRSVLDPMGTWKPLQAAAVVLKPTVKDIANDIRLGAIDAAIVWDATIAEYAGALASVAVPELADAVEQAMATVLTVSTQPAQALAFARYCAAPAHGGRIFAAHGYAPPVGERMPSPTAAPLDPGQGKPPASLPVNGAGVHDR